MSRCDRPTRRVRRSLAVAGLSLLVVAGLWAAGCAPEKRYRVLSFFFDGVPDPNAPKAPEGGRLVRGRRGQPPVVVYAHKPYEQEKCDDCHARSGRAVFSEASTPTAAICEKCHAGVRTAYPVMHGPVAAEACLWCHDAHQAPNKHLLKAPSPQVCLQCHERDQLGDKPPEHQLADADCLGCHVGHGGPEHKLLRTSLPSTAPTSQPTTAPNAASDGDRPATQPVLAGGQDLPARPEALGDQRRTLTLPSPGVPGEGMRGGRGPQVEGVLAGGRP